MGLRPSWIRYQGWPSDQCDAVVVLLSPQTNSLSARISGQVDQPMRIYLLYGNCIAIDRVDLHDREEDISSRLQLDMRRVRPFFAHLSAVFLKLLERPNQVVQSGVLTDTVHDPQPHPHLIMDDQHAPHYSSERLEDRVTCPLILKTRVASLPHPLQKDRRLIQLHLPIHVRHLLKLGFQTSQSLPILPSIFIRVILFQIHDT